MHLHQQLRSFIKQNATEAFSKKGRSFDDYKKKLSELQEEEETLREELNEPDLSKKQIADIKAEIAQLQGVRFGILWTLGIVD